jgi:hypothetical protein
LRNAPLEKERYDDQPKADEAREHGAIVMDLRRVRRRGVEVVWDQMKIEAHVALLSGTSTDMIGIVTGKALRER